MHIAYSIDSLFLFVSAILVIFMQAGFSMVEVGLNSAKNAVNILFKNTIDFCIGVTLFYFIGYALMYPGADFAGKYFGYAQPDFSAEVTTDDIKAGFRRRRTSQTASSGGLPFPGRILCHSRDNCFRGCRWSI